MSSPAQSRPRVLVLGSTGTTGSRVARALSGAAEVRTTTRRGGSGGHDGAVRFDWTDESTHSPALLGVDAVYVVPPVGEVDPVAVLAPFLRRAADAGCERVVLLGAHAVASGEPGIGQAYELVARFPAWAVLRPSWFMQNFLGDHVQARSLRTDGTVRSATGDGRVPFVDADDIAAVAARALVGAPLNREVVVTGPRSLSYDEVADVLTRVTGRPVVHRRLTETEMAEEVFGDVPASFAAVLASLDARIAAGEWSTPTDEVERLTGRPATSLEQVLRRHRDALRIGSPAGGTA